MSFTPFNNEDLDRAMSRLSMLKFWPSEPATRAEIKTFLAKKVPHREALIWLVDQFVEKIGQWHGPAELLGVLDCKYRPTDGESHWSTLPGYTAEDMASRGMEIASQKLFAEFDAMEKRSQERVKQLANGLPSIP